MKKKLTIITLALAAVLSMSACSAERDKPATDSLWEKDVRLIDGRTVHCIGVPGKHGFSCDWENAK